MKYFSYFLNVLAAGLVMCLGIPASATAAPASLTYDGAVYTMDYSVAGTNDYKFTLHINETGLTNGAWYLGSLAFSPGGNGYIFNLLSTPDGVANWTVIAGGLSANGCDGSGVPWTCIQDNANGGKGHYIKPYSSHSNDQYSFELKNAFFDPIEGIDLKAQYVNADNAKVGSLISDWISPVPVTPVPEPETYTMMLVGLGLLGFAARRNVNV